MIANYINYIQYNNDDDLFEGLTDIPNIIKDKISIILNSKQKIIDKHNLRINKLKLKLKNNSKIDPNYIEKVAKKYAIKTVNKIKNDSKIKELGKKPLNESLLIESLFKDPSNSVFKQQINEMWDEFFNGSAADMFTNITVATFTLVVIIVINTFFAIIFISLTGNPDIGLLLTAILIAPVTEEIGKFISIKYKFSLPFLIAFNVTEFSLYVARYFSVYGIIIIPIRLIGVLLHTLWTVIMRKNYQEGDKKPYIFTGFLHMLANSFGILGWIVTFVSYTELNPKKVKTKEVAVAN